MFRSERRKVLTVEQKIQTALDTFEDGLSDTRLTANSCSCLIVRRLKITSTVLGTTTTTRKSRISLLERHEARLCHDG